MDKMHDAGEEPRGCAGGKGGGRFDSDHQQGSIRASLRAEGVNNLLAWLFQVLGSGEEFFSKDSKGHITGMVNCNSTMVLA